MALSKGKSSFKTRGGSLVRAIAWVLVITGSFLILACGSGETAEKTLDKVSDPGVTQPPRPDPNAAPAENQRDKKQKERPVNETSFGPEPSTPKSAPEDSEVSAMMNSDGSITEIRVFKSHPQIARVEARWFEPATKDLKVFLRSGKVLEAKTDKIPYLHEASSELILQIAGVRPSATAKPR